MVNGTTQTKDATFARQELVIPPPEPGETTSDKHHLMREERGRNKCTVRDCNTYVTRRLVDQVSAKRLAVVKETTTCTHLGKLQAIYSDMNVCDAPYGFNTDKVFVKHRVSNDTYILYSLMYGPCVIPGDLGFRVLAHMTQ